MRMGWGWGVHVHVIDGEGKCSWIRDGGGAGVSGLDGLISVWTKGLE